MQIRKYDGLEIEKEAKTPHMLYFKIQKIAYVLMIIFLLASFFGMFGPGILNPTIKKNEFLSVEYYPNLHQHSDSSVRIEVFNPKNNIIQVWVPYEYIDKMWIKQIIPEPLYVESDGFKLIYNFRVMNLNAPVRIDFMVEPKRPSYLKVMFGVGATQGIKFHQLIYP